MFALAIKLVLVMAVMLGGGGLTAAAAQSSLPNEALYPVKLFIEDAELSLTSGPEAQIDVQLNHAQQRVREMVQLTDRGAAIPAEVPERLQTQLQAALQIAAQLDDSAMPAALDRIRLRTQDQLRQMEQLHLSDATQALTQARDMAQLGQNDPHAFRARWGHGQPDAVPPQPHMTPQADPSRTPQPSRTAQPSRTPQATGTPQNHGYGPGPLDTQQPAATPAGQGDGHEYGPGPKATTSSGGGSEPQSAPQGTSEPQPQSTPQPGGNDNGGGSDNGAGNTDGSGGSGRP